MKYMLVPNNNHNNNESNSSQNSIDASGFAISFNTNTMQLFLQDETTVYQLTKRSDKYIYPQLCGLPYGHDKRLEREKKRKLAQRKQKYIPREITKLERKINKLSKKNKDGKYDDKIDKWKQDVKNLKLREKEAIVIPDDENPDLVTIPTLFGKTFANDEILVTFIDKNNICIENKVDESISYTLFRLHFIFEIF